MSRLLPKCLILAFALLLLFLTFTAFQPPLSMPSTASLLPTKDESLFGAVHQQQGHSPPPAFTPSSETAKDPKAQEAAARKKAEDEKKRKQEEARKKKEEQERKQRAKLSAEEAAKIAGIQQKNFENARTKQDQPRIPLAPFTAPLVPKTNPDGPRPDQILLLAAADGKGHNNGIPNIINAIQPNRREYAELHGYHYMFINITKYDLHGAHPVWAKLPAIVEAFNTHPEVEWVWWLDLDAIIMTPTVTLPEHILKPAVLERRLQRAAVILRGGSKDSGFRTPADQRADDIDLIISQDLNGINAGSFMIRRSAFTRWLLDMWSDPLLIDANWIALEQDALAHLIFAHETVREHVGFVEQRVLNPYPYDDPPHGGWAKGDLLVHLAGCWVSGECKERWERYWGRKMTVAEAREKGLIKEK